jgi:DNA-binding CsgD family transcriptional regulator/ketosteroid isomerase-like protein
VSITDHRSSASHKDLLADWFRAYNRQDIAALCRLADPEIEIVPLDAATTAPPGTTYHGHDGMHSLMKPGFERYPYMRIESEQPAELRGAYVVSITFVLDDGESTAVERRATCVFRLRSDRIESLTAFATADEALRTLEDERRLTPREREVIALLADGLSVAQLAETLVLSPLTVRTHIRNAKERLGARSTSHAVAVAVRTGEIAS